jgi:hypothetical protein
MYSCKIFEYVGFTKVTLKEHFYKHGISYDALLAFAKYTEFEQDIVYGFEV